jgi:hypothetical protein
MSGSLTVSDASLTYAVKALGGYGPTDGFLGVQGSTDFDGEMNADWAGRELGVVGISTGTSIADNFGVIGFSNNAGVRGEWSDDPTANYGELGKNGVGVFGTGTTYGAQFVANASNAHALNATANGQYSQAVHATNTYDGATVYAALATNATGVIGYYSGNSYGWVGTANYGLYGQNGAASGRGVYGYSYGATGTGVYAYAAAADGTGLYARGGASGWAGDFQGKVRIRSVSTGATVMELGEGLDYAEGFDLSDPHLADAGMVLVIDPDHPGKLRVSDTPYDTKVAGIVAGANGLGSGVRLGAGAFDQDVALAGRVYCNVDATQEAIETGDLLTTSALPGYAMKVSDHQRAQGAILGKAMSSLEQGRKGQILVLVTLQ